VWYKKEVKHWNHLRKNWADLLKQDMLLWQLWVGMFVSTAWCHHVSQWAVRFTCGHLFMIYKQQAVISSISHLFSVSISKQCVLVWCTLEQRVYRVSREECAILRECVPYVKVCRYNPKHLCPKLNGYRDNGPRTVWTSCGSKHYTCQLTTLIGVWPWACCPSMTH
jgi:hypothetical protein